MRILFYFSVFLSFLFNLDDRSKESKIAHKIIENTALKFKEKYNAKFSSIKERGNPGVYSLLGMSFDINKTLSKEEGRKLLHIFIEDFLKEINSDQEFSNYMSNYPFTEKNIDISIYAMGKDGIGSFYPNILGFTWDGMKIRYFIYLKDSLCPYIIEEESF